MVDYSKFNATNEVQTPLCSARDFAEYQRLLAEKQQSTPPTNGIEYERSISSPINGMASPTQDQPTNEERKDACERSNVDPMGGTNGIPSLTRDFPTNGEVKDSYGPPQMGGLTCVEPPTHSLITNEASKNSHLWNNSSPNGLSVAQPTLNMSMNFRQDTSLNLGQPVVNTPTILGQSAMATPIQLRQTKVDTPLDIEQPTVDTPLLSDVSNTSDC